MARPFCDRCKTEVILDSDGRSCPNCGAELVRPVPKKPAAPATTRVSSLYPGRYKTRRNPPPRSAA